MTAILGISAFYHDSAAALVIDGEIVAAAQEERFSRKKHDHAFPSHAINYCLKEGRISPEELDLVGFYDKPFLKFERLLETYLAYAPVGFRSFASAMPLWLRYKLHLPRVMNKGLQYQYKKRYVFTLHHESHAASAFFSLAFRGSGHLDHGRRRGVGHGCLWNRSRKPHRPDPSAPIPTLAGIALLGLHLLHRF